MKEQYLLQDFPITNVTRLSWIVQQATRNTSPTPPFFLLCSAPFPTASSTSLHASSSSFVCYEFNYLICSYSDLIIRQGISINSLDDRSAQPTTTAEQPEGTQLYSTLRPTGDKAVPDAATTFNNLLIRTEKDKWMEHSFVPCPCINL